jgi:hypothetical protein
MAHDARDDLAAVERYADLRRAIRRDEPAVSLAVEKAGRDPTPLRMFAADLDDPEAARVYHVGARAVVERAQLLAKQARPVARGKAGRRGYPKKALDYAIGLRGRHPTMTLADIRERCVEKFGKDSVPYSVDAFRHWLNRKRTN